MKKSSMMVIVIPLVALFLLISAVVAVKTFFMTINAEEINPLPILQIGSKKATQGFGSSPSGGNDAAVTSLQKELEQTTTESGTSDLDSLDKQAAGL